VPAGGHTVGGGPGDCNAALADRFVPGLEAPTAKNQRMFTREPHAASRCRFGCRDQDSQTNHREAAPTPPGEIGPQRPSLSRLFPLLRPRLTRLGLRRCLFLRSRRPGARMPTATCAIDHGTPPRKKGHADPGERPSPSPTRFARKQASRDTAPEEASRNDKERPARAAHRTPARG